MKNYYPFIFLSSLYLSTTFSSCKKDDNSGNRTSSSFVSRETLKQNKNDFAKIIVKALDNKDFREFLKIEALKKFDADYDILYPMVKNYKIADGKSVSDFLNSTIKQNNLNTSLEEIEKNLPLLTILVPHLEKFSAETWDTENQIPIVGVRDEEDIKNKRKLQAYTTKGEVIELDYTGEPTVPIIVVKDNEAVDIVSNNNNTNYTLAHSDISKNSPILVNNDLSYFFSDENLYKIIKNKGNKEETPENVDPSNTGNTSNTGNNFAMRLQDAMGCARVIGFSYFDALVQQAYNKNIYRTDCPENVATTRDYVYYGIDPTTGTTRGNLKYNYRENITSIRLENLNTRSRFDDFSEGSILDFDITVYTADNDPVFPLKKRLSIPKSDFVTGNKYELVGTSYIGRYPLELAVWNFKRQGDIWKFSIFEYDPGSTISETRTIQATAGTNFSIGDEKIGGKFGTTATYSITKSITITYTNVSDDLGESLSYWCDRVVKRKWTEPEGSTHADPCFTGIQRPLRVATEMGQSYDIGTGVIALTVEPRMQR